MDRGRSIQPTNWNC